MFLSANWSINTKWILHTFICPGNTKQLSYCFYLVLQSALVWRNENIFIWYLSSPVKLLKRHQTVTLCSSQKKKEKRTITNFFPSALQRQNACEPSDNNSISSFLDRNRLQCKFNASSYQSLSHIATGIWICFAAPVGFAGKDPGLSSC